MGADTADNEVSRRRLLDVFLSGGLLAFLGAVLYPVTRYLTTPKVQETSASSVVAAKVDQVKPNSGLIFRFGSKPGILIRLPSGQFRAFTAVCTHLGCTVQFRSDLELIWCPCHNGRYNLAGKNVGGPPPTPLESFDVNVRGEDVVVSRRA
jgi:Rieske Fe-S protein